MLNMITHESSLQEFEQQVHYALTSFNKDVLPAFTPKNILICGLGGSGIGGRITKAYFKMRSPIPIEVCSGYEIPAFCNQDTLVILSSYSGNTEETLHMCEDALKVGATLIGISSGGAIMNKLKELNAPCFSVPTGYQPRMALGFSLSLLLLIVGHYTAVDTASELTQSLDVYRDKESHKTVAKHIFESWSHQPSSVVSIVADEFFAPVATRFVQQVNENAKGQAYVLEMPEANHNAIEAIYGQMHVHTLFLNSGHHPRVNLRFQFIDELMTQNDNPITQLQITGATLSEMFRVTYVLDWVSLYLSNAKGVDNMTVPNVDQLKNFLSK
jgi:glucose/mannose-6-phosphate isomerase